MKRAYKKLLVLLAVFTICLSCEDYLDVSPDFGITADEVFSDYYATRSIVDRAYRLINNYKFQNNDFASEVGCISDETQISRTNSAIHTDFNSGNWLNANWRDLDGMTPLTESEEFADNRDRFGNSADKGMWGIRAVSTVIENIEKLEEYPTEIGFTPQQLKDQLLGQSYYLRAFHYFEIIRRYGGFPILDRVLPVDLDFDQPRPTYLESTDFMVEDLNKAIQLLPESWTGPNYGRASKSSARALKAMALLYAASPLMNPQLNPYGSESRTYNQEYAVKAAQAAVEAINGFAAGGYEMHTLAEYTENWYSRTATFSKESLVVPPHSPYTSPANQMFGLGWYQPRFAGGQAMESQPTHNATEWFETADGYDINDPEAISSGSYDPTNPYANRDPRFKICIFSHGDNMFLGLSNQPPANRRVLDAKEGGWHFNFQQSANLLWAGYYHAAKHRWPGNDTWNNAGGYFTYFPYIRVAQVYLDLAEAANEAYGPTGAIPGSSLTAVSALNMVRNRANMPNVLSKYTVDKETFKKRIYNERAVELFEEHHRWFDLRRWKLAKQVLGEELIYRADIRVVNGELVYSKTPLDGAVRVHEDKHYWYPFPTEVMNNFILFEQNPGW